MDDKELVAKMHEAWTGAIEAQYDVYYPHERMAAALRIARESIVEARDKEWDKAITGETQDNWPGFGPDVTAIYIDKIRARFAQEPSKQERVKVILTQVHNREAGYGPDSLSGVAAEMIAALEKEQK